MKWYLKAAEQGNATAMFNVGNCYAHGYGIPQDDEQAAEWYQKAVRHGNKKAASACATASKQEKEKNRMRRLKKRFFFLQESENPFSAAQQPSKTQGKNISPWLKEKTSAWD